MRFKKSLDSFSPEMSIKFKVACLSLKTLQSSKPFYLHHLLKIQPRRCTRSTSAVTLLLPPYDSSSKITNRSFRHAAPRIRQREVCQKKTGLRQSWLKQKDSNGDEKEDYSRCEVQHGEKTDL
jgi:hypothetical protein